MPMRFSPYAGPGFLSHAAITESRLARPHMAFMPSLISAYREGLCNGDGLRKTPAQIHAIEDEPAAFVAHSLAPAPPTMQTPSGESVATVPHEQFWLINQDQLVGIINLRQHLSPFLRTYGGHIGYQIRPAAYCRGYGSHLLALGLEYARNTLGLDRVLLTCDDQNVGSIGVIRANGGRSYEQRPSPVPPGRLMRLYWLNTDRAVAMASRPAPLGTHAFVDTRPGAGQRFPDEFGAR